MREKSVSILYGWPNCRSPGISGEVKRFLNYLDDMFASFSELNQLECASFLTIDFKGYAIPNKFLMKRL